MGTHNFKKGDVVRVLPYEDIEQKFVGNTNMMPSGCHFVSGMICFCGEEFVISSEWIGGTRGFEYYRLDGAGTWSFTDEMLEPADHIVVEDLGVSFDDIASV